VAIFPAPLAAHLMIQPTTRPIMERVICPPVGQIQPRERASWAASWRLAAPSLAAAEDR
jgi:hypothetical protein